MKLLLETTAWGDKSIKNHTYLVNDTLSQLIGYIPAGTTEIKRFSEPINWDRRGRTFKEVKDRKVKQDSDVITVTGSKGAKYYISKADGVYRCSCPGFGFRGTCKHVAEVQQRKSND